MSNIVEFRKRTKFEHRGPRFGCDEKNVGQLTYLDDRRPDAAQKAKSFLDPRQVVEYYWHETSFSVTVKLDEREIAIVERYPRALDRVLSHICEFYFDAAFRHMEADDPAITPFIIREVKRWSAKGDELRIEFEVAQSAEKNGFGVFVGDDSDKWLCSWLFKPLA
ncbi:MAG: hypothetical protein WC457_02600 [Patescibacteria group bacterium]